MSGEPIESLKNGITLLIQSLKQEPQALETVYVSVITFNTYAQLLVPLTDLFSFEMSVLKTGGKVALGEALELVYQCILKDVVKPTHNTKGDWKPLVFILLSGNPTDDWIKVAAKLKKENVTIVACIAGFNINAETLKTHLENVVELKSASSKDIAKYFKWITVTTQTDN